MKTSTSVAHYHVRIGEQLEREGEARVPWAGIGKNAARTRLHKAAQYVGVEVTTQLRGDYIVGSVLPKYKGRWAIVCADGRFECASHGAARSRLESIERMGACKLEHKLVPVRG